MAELEDHVAENYRQLVEDPARPETFVSIAEYADEHASPTLAAWARQQAEAAGEDITPYDAKHQGGDVTRGYADLKVAELHDALALRGVDHAQLKLKADLIAALEAEDAKTEETVDDEYAELTDDEVRQLAIDSSLGATGSRADIIARLEAATE